MLTRANIGGVPVDVINLERTVHLLDSWITFRERRCIYRCTVHSIICCMRDPQLRRDFSQADLVTADGMPLVRILQCRWPRQVSRVYGPDLMLALCDYLQERGSRHFFYGGAPGVAERLATCLKARYPKIQIAGAMSPPFRPLTASEDRQAVSLINDSRADVVWIGLGAPKQERWMAEHRDRLGAALLIGVGYAFDALSGAKPQAPRWIRQAGFEWAFRVVLEPRRLWPRVLIDGPLFLVALAGQVLRLKRFKIPAAKPRPKAPTPACTWP